MKDLNRSAAGYCLPKVSAFTTFRSFILLCVLLASHAGAAPLTGQAVDGEGNPVPGVWISITDAAQGCVFCGEVAGMSADNSGQFSFDVPVGVYTVVAFANRDGTHRWARARVENGQDPEVTLVLDGERRDLLPDTAPIASLITINAPDEDGNTVISGQIGSVIGNSTLIITNLDTADIAFGTAAPDGSFSISTRGRPGTAVQVKADPTGWLAGNVAQAHPGHVTGSSDITSPISGTIIRVPRTDLHTGPNSVEGGGVTWYHEEYGDYTTPEWTFSGATNGQAFVPGETLNLTGVLKVRSPILSAAGSLDCDMILKLEIMSDEDGQSTMGRNQYASTNLTTTGFPIERLERFSDDFDGYITFPLNPENPSTVSAPIDISMQLPADLPHGYYRPYFRMCPLPDLREQPPLHRKTVLESGFSEDNFRLTLPVIRVGTPADPRLFMTLLSDTPDNGSRGLVAREDADTLGVSARVATRSRDSIYPRTSFTGEPLKYRLEPFTPQISWGDRTPPVEPRLLLKFPSGQLKVTIHQPDGSTRVLGPAPFVQSRMKSISNHNGELLATGGGQPTDLYQLSTMNPAFDVEFEQDGAYRVVMEASIEDIWGNEWQGGGTYDFHIANRLVADTTVFPGTPFEVGDVFHTGVTLYPAVPADVSATLVVDPYSDPTQRIERTITGKANRFGHFEPDEGGLELTVPGEYRFDITVSHTDAKGRLWMGSRTFGGVVAPTNASITAHGRRGIDTSPEIGQAWFSQEGSNLPIPAHHVNQPFFSGDIAWVFELDSITTTMTFDETGDEVASIMGPRLGFASWIDSMEGPGTFEQRTAVGEIPLWSSQPGGGSIQFDPSRVDLWAYSYRSIQRPMVRVREFVSEELVDSPYWRFGEQYNRQVGMGQQGDLPNDVKFQYGGVVLRGTALSSPLYAIYGSTAVILPADDDQGGYRVFPPFQGNGGGPSGGPLLVHKGEDVDLLVNLRGVRPGSVFDVGDTFSLSGAIAPALPTHLRYTVTRPDGSKLTFGKNNDRISNRIGYFYLPSDDFVLDQAGHWTVEFEAEFSGRTSAGQVTAPFPTGSVLGAEDSTFSFYVTETDAPLLPLAGSEFSILPVEWREDGGHFELDFNASLPPGHSFVSGHVTTMMPGTVLESRALGSDLVYSLNLNQLASDVPNLDCCGYIADALTISLFVEARGPSGQPVHMARIVNVHGDEVSRLDAFTRALIIFSHGFEE